MLSDVRVSYADKFLYVFAAVPLEIPSNFRLDPSKEVTDTTADFLWDSVNQSPARMQGYFRGYKVTQADSAGQYKINTEFIRTYLTSHNLM